jgi:hypothetical protein
MGDEQVKSDGQERNGENKMGGDHDVGEMSSRQIDARVVHERAPSTLDSPRSTMTSSNCR